MARQKRRHPATAIHITVGRGNDAILFEQRLPVVHHPGPRDVERDPRVFTAHVSILGRDSDASARGEIARAETSLVGAGAMEAICTRYSFLNLSAQVAAIAKPTSFTEIVVAERGIMHTWSPTRLRIPGF